MESGKAKRRIRTVCSAHGEALTIAAFCLSACEVFFLYRNFRIPGFEPEHLAVPMFGSFIAVFVALMACIALLGASMLFGKRIENDRFLTGAALCAFIGPLAQLVLVHFLGLQWAFLPCIILSSGGCVCFLPELIRRIASAGVTSAVRCSIACCVLLLFVAPASSLVSLEVFTVFMAAIPLLLLGYFRFTDPVDKAVRIEAVPGQKLPRILLLTILMAGMMEGIVAAVDDAKMPAETKAVVFSLALVVATVLMFAILLHLRGSFNNALFRLCIPMMAAGIALFVFEGNLALEAGTLVFLVGRQLFAGTILALVVYLIRYQESDYYLLTLGTVIGAMLGSFAGLLLFRVAGQVADPTILPPAFLVFVLLFALVAAMNLMNAASLKTRWGMTAIDDSEQQVGLTFEQSCLFLAEQQHLTKRECEIVVLMARGKDKQAIAEKLFISEGTVKVHARNIYQKLGIHSKQELITLVEQTEASIKE